MAKISIFGALSNISILLHTALKGSYVGTDQNGNRYYRAKARKGTKRERRWVIYYNQAEASMVPAEWHGWLHHQTNTLPADMGRFRKKWQKPHKPNMTGTSETYLPPGHTLRGGKREAATGDYQAWVPPQ